MNEVAAPPAVVVVDILAADVKRARASRGNPLVDVVRAAHPEWARVEQDAAGGTLRVYPLLSWESPVWRYRVPNDVAYVVHQWGECSHVELTLIGEAAA